MSKVFWEQVKENKWSLFVDPKATLMNLVQHNDKWLATCLFGVKQWPLSITLETVQAEARQWMKSEILPQISAWL